MSIYNQYAESVRQRRADAERAKQEREFSLHNAAARLIELINAYAGIDPEINGVGLTRANDHEGQMVGATQLIDFDGPDTLKFGLSFSVICNGQRLGTALVPASLSTTNETSRFALKVKGFSYDFEPGSTDGLNTAEDVWNVLVSEFNSRG
ncbi:hypothetical protein SB783_05210 [Paraburkholderia sp. SIMBA_009]